MTSHIMMHPVIAAVVVLVAVNLLCISAASGCTIVAITGATSQTWIDGHYTLSSTCNGRPTFTQTGTAEGDIYLYYIDGSSAWILGEEACAEWSYAIVIDDAQSPERITSVWQEHNYITGNTESNPSLDAHCISNDPVPTTTTRVMPSTTVRITGCTAITASGADIQTRINGQYSLYSSTCNGRPTFLQRDTSEGDIYLFFHTEAAVGSAWVFGPHVCGQYNYAVAYDDAGSPELTNAGWYEHDYQTAWKVPNSRLRTVCTSTSGSDTTTTMKGMTTTTTARTTTTRMSITTVKDCTEITISGADIQKWVDGRYTLYGACNGKPTFRKIDTGSAHGTIYLHYWYEYPNGAWMLDKKNCGTMELAHAVGTGVKSPELLTAAAVWFEHDYTSGLKHANLDLDVRCTSTAPVPVFTTPAVSTEILPSTGCTSITANGADIHIRLNGRYTRQSSICNGRPTFVKTDTTKGDIYLFFYVITHNGGFMWMFGHRECDQYHSALAWDDAASPELITEDWHEFDSSRNSLPYSGLSTRCTSGGAIPSTTTPVQNWEGMTTTTTTRTTTTRMSITTVKGTGLGCKHVISVILLIGALVFGHLWNT